MFEIRTIREPRQRRSSRSVTHTVRIARLPSATPPRLTSRTRLPPLRHHHRLRPARIPSVTHHHNSVLYLLLPSPPVSSLHLSFSLPCPDLPPALLNHPYTDAFQAGCEWFRSRAAEVAGQDRARPPRPLARLHAHDVQDGEGSGAAREPTGRSDRDEHPPPSGVSSAAERLARHRCVDPRVISGPSAGRNVQTHPLRPDGGERSGRRLELGEDVLEVRCDRARSDDQRERDVGVRAPFDDQSEYLELTGRQPA